MTARFGITDKDFANLTSLMVTCRLLKCLPCLLIFLLPTDEQVQLHFKQKETDHDQEEEEEDGEAVQGLPWSHHDGYEPMPDEPIVGQTTPNFLPPG